MPIPTLRLRVIPVSFLLLGAAALAAEKYASVVAPTGWRQHDMARPKPAVVTPLPDAGPVPAPEGTVSLFDGKGLDAWQTPEGKEAGWAVKEGFFEVTPGTGPIQTKARFGDVQVHAEWASPDPPAGVSQDRGNSGIFLMGQFELQVLDSYRADTYADGQAGAIYGQYPPLFNASRAPGQWQSYDVAFRRPRFDASGKLTSPARMTVFLNGVLVQDNEELWGQTSWLEPLPFDPGLRDGPIQLQDHGHPVRFRNIWVREIPERPAPDGRSAQHPEVAKLSSDELDAIAGVYEFGSAPKDFRLTIIRDGDALRLKLPFRPVPLTLAPLSPEVCVLPHTDGRLTFMRNSKEQIDRCEFQIGDGKRLLTRAAR